MLRSMLKVRNGSGWSLRQTASAANPSEERSAERSKVTPSAKPSRSPSRTRCKIAATVEDKVHSFRGQAQRGGHLRELPESGNLGRAEVIGQGVCQVIVTGRDIQAEPRTVLGRQFVRVLQALGPATSQRLGKVAEVNPRPGH